MKAKKNVSEERHSDFQVGNEYDAKQLTFAYNTPQMFEDKLTALEKTTQSGKLTIEQVHYHCDRTKDEIGRGCATEIHLLENKSEQLNMHLEVITDDHIQSHYEARRDHHVQNQQKEITKRFGILKTLHLQMGSINDELQIKKKIRENYKDAPLVRSLLNRSYFYFPLIALFALGDSILSFQSMQFLGEGLPNIALLWLTFLVAAGIAVGAHFTGASIAKKQSKPFWISLVVSMFFVAVLLLLRVDVQASLTLSLLNFGFFGLASVISYRRYSTQDYFTLISEIKALENRKAKLESNIASEQAELDAETNALELSVSHWVKEEVAQDTLHNKMTAKNLTKAIEGLNKVLTSYCNRVEIIRRGALANIAARKERKNQKGFSFNIPDFGLSTAIRAMLNIFIVALMVSCSGNKSKDEKPTYAIVIVDLTDEQQKRPDAQTVLTHLGDMNEGEVTLSVISDMHSYPYKNLSLAPASSFLSQVPEKEQNRIANYQKEFITAYNTLPVPITEPKESFVFSAIARSLKAHRDKIRINRKIIIYSDLVQHEKDGINFYEYKDSPERLTRDYHKILADFRTQYDPEHRIYLWGLEIIVYHTPTKEMDELWLYQQQFYTQFFKDHGARSVQFHPYAPSSNELVQAH